MGFGAGKRESGCVERWSKRTPVRGGFQPVPGLSWCVLGVGSWRGEGVSCCSLTPGPSPATGSVLLLEAGCAGEGGNDFDSLPGVSTCGGYPGPG
jgi:hypothetical protein